MFGEPFVDFRAKIHTVSPQQQAVIIGRSNLTLVEQGAVKWSDVVTTGRVRSLREVVARQKLTVKDMVGVGVDPRQANEAWNAVNTASHTAAELRRKQLSQALVEKGYSREQIRDAAGQSLGQRLVLGGPSGRSVFTAPPLTIKAKPVPDRMAALTARQAYPVPPIAPIKARAGRMVMSRNQLDRFLLGILQQLAEKYGLIYKPPAEPKDGK